MKNMLGIAKKHKDRANEYAQMLKPLYDAAFTVSMLIENNKGEIHPVLINDANKKLYSAVQGMRRRMTMGVINGEFRP